MSTVIPYRCHESWEIDRESNGHSISQVKTVNLVNFNRCRIEISFNDDLDKDFIKILSTKLYEWTNERWIITLSKEKGAPSKKEIKLNQKSENLEEAKTSTIYKRLIENFGDAELIDVELKDIKND